VNNAAAGASAANARAAALNRSRYGPRGAAGVAGSRLQPPSNLTIGDMWFETDYNYHPWFCSQVTPSVVWRDALTDAPAGTPGNKTSYGASAPSSPSDGDLWFDTTLQRWRRYNLATTTWVTTGSRVTQGATAPSSPQDGDIWMDTANGNVCKVYRSSDSTWVTQGSGNAIFRQSGTPTSAKIGDLWYNTSVTPNTLQVYDGTGWANLVGTGILTAAMMATGTLSAGNITAGTLQSGVIYAGEIAANRISAGTMDTDVIYAGTVAANRITAGNLASDVINTGSLNAGNITAGTMSGDFITANTLHGNRLIAGEVTADKLTLIPMDNLWPNPWGDRAVPSGMNPGAGNVEFGSLVSVADMYRGTGLTGTGNVRRIVASGSQFNLILPLPAREGDQFYFEAFVRRTAGTGTPLLLLTCRLADGNYTSPAVEPAFTFTSSSWTKAYTSITCNAGTAQIYAYIAVPSGTTIEATGFLLQRKNDSRLIVDGGITAKHLAIVDFENLMPSASREQIVAKIAGTIQAELPNFVRNGGAATMDVHTDGTLYGWAADGTSSTGYSRLLTPGTYQRGYGPQLIPCAPGDQFWVETYVKSNGSNAAGVWCYFYNSAGNILSNSQMGVRGLAADGYVQDLPCYYVTGALWYRVGDAFTAPASAAFARPVVFANTGGNAYFHSSYARRRGKATLIVDGSIDALKLSTDIAIANQYFRTTNYNGGYGSQMGGCTQGALIDGSSSAYVAARFAPAGIMIGNKKISESWIGNNRIHRFRISWNGSIFTITTASDIAAPACNVPTATPTLLKVYMGPNSAYAPQFVTGVMQHGSSMIFARQNSLTTDSAGYADMQFFTPSPMTAANLITGTWTADFMVALGASPWA
jgi:hypothetical protein